jgi:hypothetical protein
MLASTMKATQHDPSQNGTPATAPDDDQEDLDHDLDHAAASLTFC